MYVDVFYATNNPYQVNGPKGFTEFKYMEETHDLYVRLDFPGIKEESVVTLVEPSKKAVIVTGDAPKESEHDSSHRKYRTVTGLICDSCEISNIQSFVGDGVVRLIISKNKINLHVPTLCSCKFKCFCFCLFFCKINSDILYNTKKNLTFFVLILFGGAKMPTDLPASLGNVSFCLINFDYFFLFSLSIY